MNSLSKYSFGAGDRFAHQAKAQLAAIIQAKKNGVEITPVWNKSYREHTTINSHPSQTREAADAAVKASGWDGPYFLDADHITLKTVDHFIDYCDFFTLDVADYIGMGVADVEKSAFLAKNKKYIGNIDLPGLHESFPVTEGLIRSVADKYLFAVKEAARIYKHIASKKEGDSVVFEVSMDETDKPQTPPELFFILSAIASEGIPISTIAPKFSGRFNKGVDYVGNAAQFKTEFEQDVSVLRLAVSEFGMKKGLKLSVHSGSDKFSLYPIIRDTIKKFDAGVHIKTAGTTWLEEVTGLAESAGEGLRIAKKIYAQSLEKFDELCAPYAAVIDIDRKKLPSAEDVQSWDGEKFARTLRHDSSDPLYNRHFRQLIHVGYKVAAKLGDEYLHALEDNEEIVAKNVIENLYVRHIQKLFI